MVYIHLRIDASIFLQRFFKKYDKLWPLKTMGFDRCHICREYVTGVCNCDTFVANDANVMPHMRKSIKKLFCWDLTHYLTQKFWLSYIF